eukprot:10490410-Ditylum_brightwellii.AAC.1
MGPLLQNLNTMPNAPPFFFSEHGQSGIYRIFAASMDETDGESGSSSGDETDDDDDEGPDTSNAAAPDPQSEESDFSSLAGLVKDLSILTNTSSYMKSNVPKQTAT